MDSLPAAAAVVIAGYLLDERDLAALAATSRFWRGILADPALWRCLLRRRFGAAASAGASPLEEQTAHREGVAAAAETAAETAAARPSPRQRFRQLACLRRPAPQLDRVALLDGVRLQAGPGRGADHAQLGAQALGVALPRPSLHLPPNTFGLALQPCRSPPQPPGCSACCCASACRWSQSPAVPAGRQCVCTKRPGWSWLPGCRGCFREGTVRRGACACRCAAPGPEGSVPACAAALCGHDTLVPAPADAVQPVPPRTRSRALLRACARHAPPFSPVASIWWEASLTRGSAGCALARLNPERRESHTRVPRPPAGQLRLHRRTHRNALAARRQRGRRRRAGGRRSGGPAAAHAA